VRFEVEVAGRTRTVGIERQGRRYRVTVDGQPHEVDVARTGRSWSLLIGTRSYEIAFVPLPGGETLVYVDGHPVVARRSGPGDAKRPGLADARPGPQRILAPMPGRILKVLVKSGDAVVARQGLVVVEAMKMENELRSAKAGIVAEVRVTEGMSVEANAVLVVVD
jgi:biotin carboxyl carrier protein